MITPTFIGSFGQSDLWSLGDPGSYQHPLTPDDVRLDPSLPEYNDKIKRHKSLAILLDEEVEVGVACDGGMACDGGVACEDVTDVEEVRSPS